MHVSRDLDLAVPPATLWATLWDVPRMVSCLPGCAEAREVEPHRRYAATMTQRATCCDVPAVIAMLDRQLAVPRAIVRGIRRRHASTLRPVECDHCIARRR